VTLPAVGAQIQAGLAGEVGGVVAVLAAPDETGVAAGCVTDLERSLIKAVRKHPAERAGALHHPPGTASRGGPLENRGHRGSRRACWLWPSRVRPASIEAMSGNPPGDWRNPAPNDPAASAWPPSGNPSYGPAGWQYPPQPGTNPPPGSYPPPGTYPPPGSYPPAGTYPPPGTYPPQGTYPPPGTYPPQGTYPPPGTYPQPPAAYPPGAYPVPGNYPPPGTFVPPPARPEPPAPEAPGNPPSTGATATLPPPPTADGTAQAARTTSEAAGPAGPSAAGEPWGDRRSSVDRGPIIGGFIVAGIGLFLLFGQIVSNVGQWIPLFVGLVFLAAFIARREYGFLVAGCIITGVGAGIVLAERASGDLSGAAMLLSIAAGFLAIWVVGAVLRLPENHWWPFIPGGILAIVGITQLADARGYGDLRLWPLIIVGLGVLLIGRALLDQRRRPPRGG
jgi:hypothetical protein